MERVKVKIGTLLVLSVLVGCKGKLDFSKKKAEDEKVIVQFGEHFLTDRDIRLILPKDISKDDSTKLVNTYIEEWVKKKAIVDKAEDNIDELTLKEIDNKMVEYRQDLLINAYNNYLIEKNLTDSVSDAEVLAYFEENKESFPLIKDVVRYRAVTVMKSDEDRVNRLFNSGRDEDFDEVMKVVLTSGTPFHDKDSIWYSTDVLQGHFPELVEGDNYSQLMNRRRLKISNDSTVTFIRILNLKPKGEKAPYEFVKPTIKNLILNKRKLNLLGDLQNQLYKEAIHNNQIKINEN
ncbi:hypothetical protein [Moheibacter lacus]|uniref:hypothetical protein n=1 Tax=Moheibacter lacus TaxID=2745851 RepID=UPI0015F36EEB|nr:hypothetical protein [Moheibacter lacus]